MFYYLKKKKKELRYNVDQTPPHFVIDTKRTYELVERGNPENQHKNVWVSQPGAGLEKRQCTLQIFFSLSGKQPKVAIIFRGSGKRISEVEKASWHPQIYVFFQKCTWADTNFCCDLVERNLKPSVDERFVLFCDNIGGQISDEFKKSVSDIGGIYWFGVKGATDIWQPVDAGYAERFKSMAKQAQYDWLDSDDNAEKWYGTDTSFTASERW